MPKLGNACYSPGSSIPNFVTKLCDVCGSPSPVACKICSGCGAEYIPSYEKFSQESPPTTDSGAGELGELLRRRSERVKREKPDYYDALDFDSKRKTTPTRGKKEKGPHFSNNMSGRSPGRPGRPPLHRPSYGPRATLTWKKCSKRTDLIDNDCDEEDDFSLLTVVDRRRRRKRAKRQRNDENEDLDYIDDLSSDKIFRCKISLAEINRKLCVVMNKC